MRLKKLLYILYIRIKERKWKGRLKYIFENNRSNELIIIFSGFSPGAPRYNYIRSLKSKKVDKLFILDVFGNRGSYYLYENGVNDPERLTRGLIHHIIKKGKYNSIITAGSSKGGSCAIYYGLLFGADDIFAGAPQYYIGDYVRQFPEVLQGMLGNRPSEEEIEKLNHVLVKTVNHISFDGVIHLLYSKNEHTYSEHIKDMINDLRKAGDSLELIELQFLDHNDVGAPFSDLLRERI